MSKRARTFVATATKEVVTATSVARKLAERDLKGLSSVIKEFDITPSGTTPTITDSSQHKYATR